MIIRRVQIAPARASKATACDCCTMSSFFIARRRWVLTVCVVIPSIEPMLDAE